MPLDKKPSLFDNTFLVFLMLFFISWALASVYQEAVQARFLMDRIRIQHSILSGTAVSPYRYRLLVVIVLGGITRALTGLMEYPAAFQLTYALYILGCFFAILSGMYRLFNRFFPRNLSFFGIVYIAATMPVTFGDHFFQPWSFLEVALYVLAVRWIYEKRHLLLIPLIIVAALNRETAVFIPVTFLLAHYSHDPQLPVLKRFDKASVYWFWTYFLIWACVSVAIRYLCGYMAHEFNFFTNLTYNAQHLLKAVKNNVIFWSVFGYFAVRGYRYAPVFFRRIAWVVPLYCAMMLFYAYWVEVRALMVLYPVFVPLGLAYISEKYEL